jgi:hypothetical protein
MGCGYAGKIGGVVVGMVSRVLSRLCVFLTVKKILFLIIEKNKPIG